jgi:hypothetical protein
VSGHSHPFRELVKTALTGKDGPREKTVTGFFPNLIRGNTYRSHIVTWSIGFGECKMSKIVRYEFGGNWLVFWLLCLTGVGIPIAVILFVNGLVRIDTEMKDPEEFLAAYRAGKVGKK